MSKPAKIGPWGGNGGRDTGGAEGIHVYSYEYPLLSAKNFLIHSAPHGARAHHSLSLPSLWLARCLVRSFPNPHPLLEPTAPHAPTRDTALAANPPPPLTESPAAAPPSGLSRSAPPVLAGADRTASRHRRPAPALAGRRPPPPRPSPVGRPRPAHRPPAAAAPPSPGTSVQRQFLPPPAVSFKILAPPLGRERDVQPKPTRLVSVTISSGEGKIDAIAFSYVGTDNAQHSSGIKWGGTGGTEDRISLDPTNYVTEISGTVGKFGTDDIVTSLKIVTFKGDTKTYGTAKGTPFRIPVLDGGKIVGFFGRAGAFLDAIGLYVYP